MRALAACVLEQAMRDLERDAWRRRDSLSSLAAAWVIEEPDEADPFSFVSICRLLTLRPDAVRAQLTTRAWP